MKVKTSFGTYNCKIERLQYPKGNLAIQLIDPNDYDIVATLTTNLPDEPFPEENQAYLDTNNCPWAEEFVKENKLGYFTGNYGHSGYCTYPLYEFTCFR